MFVAVAMRRIQLDPLNFEPASRIWIVDCKMYNSVRFSRFEPGIFHNGARVAKVLQGLTKA